MMMLEIQGQTFRWQREMDRGFAADAARTVGMADFLHLFGQQQRPAKQRPRRTDLRNVRRPDRRMGTTSFPYAPTDFAGRVR